MQAEFSPMNCPSSFWCEHNYPLHIIYYWPKASSLFFFFIALHKICENTGFYWPVFSRAKKESTVMSLCRIMRVLENPYSCIFYAMYSFIYHRCRNNVCSFVISDYFHHKATKQLWIKDSKMSGLKDLKICHENV